MLVKVTRVLPGELEDDVNPEDFGFDVVPVEPPSEAEAAARISALYTQVKERTGVTIPKIEEYLASVEAEQGILS
jgi:hypothetical protein